MATHSTKAEKDGLDVEKSGMPGDARSPDDSSDLADSTLAALQRVRSADEHHPMHWGSFKKWFIVFWYCMLQVFVTLTTTTYVSAEFLVQEKFGGTTQVIALGQSMFIIGTAVGPVFLGPLSYVNLNVWSFVCVLQGAVKRLSPVCWCGITKRLSWAVAQGPTRSYPARPLDHFRRC